MFYIKRALEESELAELELKASLHGVEFKAPPKALNVSKADSEHFDDHAEKLQQRLQRKYNEQKFKDMIINGKQ